MNNTIFDDVEVVEETTPTPMNNTQSKPNSKLEINFDIASLIGDKLTEFIQSEVHGQGATKIQQAVKEVAQGLKPTVIKIGAAKPVTVTGKLHEKHVFGLKILNATNLLWLVGPTGSGKTHLAEQLAQAFNLTFAYMSCTEGMHESHLNGKMTVTGEFLTTEFIKCYEEGGLYLLDEVDAADPNVLLVLNSAIANGKLAIPNRVTKPVAVRHPDFKLIVSSNTWGTGSVNYSGRNNLDQSFIDRFNLCKLEIDYDEALETELAKEVNPDIAAKFQLIRSNMRKSGADASRIPTTRNIITALKMFSSGISMKAIFDDQYFTPQWTAEEKRKALHMPK